MILSLFPKMNVSQKLWLVQYTWSEVVIFVLLIELLYKTLTFFKYSSLQI